MGYPQIILWGNLGKIDPQMTWGKTKMLHFWVTPPQNANVGHGRPTNDMLGHLLANNLFLPYFVPKIFKFCSWRLPNNVLGSYEKKKKKIEKKKWFAT